jgi:hypothetical protein
MPCEAGNPAPPNATGWHSSFFGHACRLVTYSLFAFLFWRNVLVDRASGQSDRLDLVFACLSTALVAGAAFGLAFAVRQWRAQRTNGARAA